MEFKQARYCTYLGQICTRRLKVASGSFKFHIARINIVTVIKVAFFTCMNNQ